jgi:hypothetical protein
VKVDVLLIGILLVAVLLLGFCSLFRGVDRNDPVLLHVSVQLRLRPRIV